MKRRKIRLAILFLSLLGLAVGCAPNMFYTNSGTSTSLGSPAAGSLENAWQIDYRKRNYSYFSPMSYYLMGNGYMNSRL